MGFIGVDSIKQYREIVCDLRVLSLPYSISHGPWYSPVPKQRIAGSTLQLQWMSHSERQPLLPKT